MSFGFGVADVKGAIQLFKWIWDNCFDKDETSDERYRRLKSSVKGLQDQVLRLHDVLENSSDAYRYDPDNADNSDLRREFKEVAGDFIQTIHKCDRLLRDSSLVKLDKDRAGFIQNVTWGATVQPTVDDLISRLRFHIDRLQIILEPVKMGDLGIIRQAVLELLETSRRQDPELQAQACGLVPGWLKDVFDDNASINTPLGVTNISEIGVKEGCDLLYQIFSYRDSLDSSLGVRGCAIRRYLNILKCQWLVNTLRETRGFPSHRSRSAFPIFVSNIEVDLYQDLRTISRTPGASVSDQDLRQLFHKTSKPFLIWDPPTPPKLRSPTKKEAGEEHILTVGLESNGPKQELLFFRKGSTDFRLVPTEEVEGTTRLSRYRKEERFNLCVDKFVARYTVGGVGSPGQIPIDLYLQGHTTPVTYHMKDMPDAWAFQRAITGYEVVGNECNVKWTAQKEFQSVSSFLAKSRKVRLRGCAQVWRWDPYKETLPALGSDNRSSVDSPDSSESGTITLPPLSIAPSQRTVNSFMTTETAIQGGVLEELRPPNSPVVAAFDHSDGRYRCHILQLRSHLVIDRSACACTPGGDGGSCRVLVVRSSRGERFDIRDLSTPEASIENWDLAVFRGPGRSAESNNPAFIKHLSCEKLQLLFETAEERRCFSDAFLVALREYTDALTEYEEYKNDLRRLGDRPIGPTRSVYGSPASPVASVSGTATPGQHTLVSDRAPRIESVAAFSRLSLGMGERW